MFRDDAQRSEVGSGLVRFVPETHAFVDGRAEGEGWLRDSARRLGFDVDGMQHRDGVTVFTAISLLEKDCPGFKYSDLRAWRNEELQPVAKLVRLMAERDHDGLDKWILDPCGARRTTFRLAVEGRDRYSPSASSAIQSSRPLSAR